MFTFIYNGKKATYRIGITSDSAVYAGFMYLLIQPKKKYGKIERIYIENFTEGLNLIASNEDITFNELLIKIGLELE